MAGQLKKVQQKEERQQQKDRRLEELNKIKFLRDKSHVDLLLQKGPCGQYADSSKNPSTRLTQALHKLKYCSGIDELVKEVKLSGNKDEQVILLKQLVAKYAAHLPTDTLESLAAEQAELAAHEAAEREAAEIKAAEAEQKRIEKAEREAKQKAVRAAKWGAKDVETDDGQAMMQRIQEVSNPNRPQRKRKLASKLTE